MTHRSPIWIVALVFASICLLTSSPFAQAAEKAQKAEKSQKNEQPKGEKVATVNGQEIAKADFDKEIGRVQKQMELTGHTPSPEEASDMKKKVLQNLIDRELLSQETKKLGIKAGDDEVAAQVTKIKQRFPGEAEFADALSKMSITEPELKTRLSSDLAINKMIEQQAVQKVAVSDNETRSFYDAHPDFFQMPERVRASHILVSSTPESSAEDKAKARKKIEAIQSRIKKGEDFAAVAKETSDCPSKASGGDLNFFQRGQMVQPFEEAAFKLKPGEVSDIVETQFGYHIIKLTDRKPAGVVSYEEAKEKIQQHLKQQKTEQEVSRYIEGLRSKADIKTFIE